MVTRVNSIKLLHNNIAYTIYIYIYKTNMFATDRVLYRSSDCAMKFGTQTVVDSGEGKHGICPPLPYRALDLPL